MRIDSKDILAKLDRVEQANAELQQGIVKLETLIDGILTRQARKREVQADSTIRVPDTLQV